MSILNNHVPSYFCQIFAQSEHLCAKLLHQDCNDAHRWKGQPKNEHDKKRTFHTNTHHQNNAERTLHMSGTHLPIFAQLQQLWLEFYSTNIDPNCQKSQKTRGLHWENKQQKLSWEPISLYLAYNMTPRLLYRTPPSATLSWHCVHRCGGAHCAKNTIPDSKEVTTTKEGG